VSKSRISELTRPLQFIVAADYDTMSRRAEEFIVDELKRRPDLLLCASAGGTPTGTYDRLAVQYTKDPKSFSQLRVVQIDEWAGLPGLSPARCEVDLKRKLVDPLRIEAQRYCGFESDAPNPEAECARMEKWLDANGPIDLCILGLGVNGHVAMNEPASAVIPGPHVAKLTPTSQHHPLLEGLTKKPKSGLTLGLGDILRSRKILLVVSGRKKRSALRRLMQPRVSTQFPASLLWLHRDATVLCDRQAAGKG
jgi:galactosamine-6-phosphate isomerase